MTDLPANIARAQRAIVAGVKGVMEGDRSLTLSGASYHLLRQAAILHANEAGPRTAVEQLYRLADEVAGLVTPPNTESKSGGGSLP